MATFEARVEGLTGLSIGGSTSPTTTQLTEYLKDGVIEVTNRIVTLKPSDVDTFSRESAEQTSNGFNPGTNKILSVIRENGTDGQWSPCSKKHISLQYKVTDIESLEYASKYNPVFMMTQNRNVHVYPEPTSGGGDGFKVLYVNSDPEELDGTDLEYNSSGIKWFPDDKVYLVVLYAGIKSLQNAMATKSAELPSDLPSVVLEGYSESLPTYTAPSSIVIPVAPAGVDIDFSNVGTIEDFVAPVFVTPDLGTISDMSLPPVPIGPILADNSITLPTSGIPAYIKPLTAPDYADANNWINTEEDDEMLAARATIINAQLTQHAADIENELNNFNKENAEYQANVQKAIEDARLGGQDDSKKLQNFSAHISLYQNEVNKEVQRWTNEEFGVKHKEWIQKYQGQLAEYQANVQKETSRVQASVTDFNAEVQKATSTYQAETGYDMAKYQAEIGAQVQKYQNDLADANATFDKNLGKYTSEVGRVSTANNSLVGKFSAEVQNYASKLNKVTKDYEWMTGRLMKLQQEYDAAFALMQPRQQQEGGR